MSKENNTAIIKCFLTCHCTVKGQYFETLLIALYSVIPLVILISIPLSKDVNK